VWSLYPDKRFALVSYSPRQKGTEDEEVDSGGGPTQGGPCSSRERQDGWAGAKQCRAPRKRSGFFAVGVAGGNTTQHDANAARVEECVRVCVRQEANE